MLLLPLLRAAKSSKQNPFMRASILPAHFLYLVVHGIDIVKKQVAAGAATKGGGVYTAGTNSLLSKSIFSLSPCSVRIIHLRFRFLTPTT